MNRLVLPSFEHVDMTTRRQTRNLRPGGVQGTAETAAAARAAKADYLPYR